MSDASQNWNDQGSQWHRAMQRKSRQWKVSFIAIIVMGVIFGPVMIWIVGDALSGQIKFLLAVPILFMILPAWLMWRQRHRHRHLVDSIIAHQGVVCPMCIGAMNIDENNQCVCPTCNRTSSKEVLIEYSVNCGIDYRAAMNQRLDYMLQGQGSIKRLQQKYAKRYGESPTFAATCAFGFWIFWGILFGLVMSLFNSDGFWGGILEGISQMGPMAFFMTGVTLLINGYVSRKGQTKHCKACGYQSAPKGPTLERCPECGTDWMKTGAIVTGEKVGTTGHFVAGVLFIAIWMVILVSPLSNSSLWKYKLLSTDALINEAVTVWYRDDVWVELGIRTLSVQQHEILAIGLLDMRLREGSASSLGGPWLDTQVALGALPSDLVTRYYDESYELGLAGPEQASDGGSIVVSMTMDVRALRTLAGQKFFVYLGDYAVNGMQVEDSRFKRVTYVSIVNGKEYSLTWTVRGTEDLMITREVWVAINPTSLQGEIQWQPDGTPVIPPGVTWMKKITLEHVIEIVE